MISKELNGALSFAVDEAKKRRHEYVSVEHVLYAILNEATGSEIIGNCGGNVDKLNGALENFFNDRMEAVPDGNEYVLQQTMGFQRVIKRAVDHARSAEKREVEIADVLASIFQEKDSHAGYFLESEGITRLDVLSYISHEIGEGITREDPGEDEKAD